ncbi:glycosyltransferase [Halomarina rubra]|uniref:Glycosyltransferase n=1 Tax=Halomarina rubra TaxID=2071873 RepID=A0ABD6AT81_9EURY|nr:glycosyltransferase [Halomarina rubra]
MDGDAATDDATDIDPATALDDVDVALAHWGMAARGGAETVVAAMADALDLDRVFTVGEPAPEVRTTYPDVEFYDVLADAAFEPARRLQARADRVFEYALWEDVDWTDYGSPDVLLTSGATTRAVITPDETLHVNYCHTTPRWLYDRYHARIEELRWPTELAARVALRYLRTRDAAVDDRVDDYLVNSPVIARRLWKFYDRESTVLYPPVDVGAFEPRDSTEGDFYLHAGRLDREKGVRAVVEAFADGDRSLVLIGPEGDDTERVLAAVERHPNVEYRGFVSLDEKRDLYERARAVVFNGVAEDFGIVPVEAVAAGTACLAREEGFPALFVDDRTGLFHDGSVAGIRDALDRFEADPFAAEYERAERFARERFADELRVHLAERYRAFERRFRV